MTVFYYPHSLKDETTVPMVGFITRGWTLGVVELGVLPTNSGTVETCKQVYHISDKRLFDHMGNITPGGRLRGCWEYTPASKLLLAQLENTPEPSEAEEADDTVSDEEVPSKAPAKTAKKKASA